MFIVLNTELYMTVQCIILAIGLPTGFEYFTDINQFNILMITL